MSLKNLFSNWSAYRRGNEEGGYHRDDYEHLWGMAINLDVCIGCNACSTACYAENNLAVVGKDKFSKGQAMHWMRIERYWDDNEKEFPERGASFLPMLCQQCNAATCEPVCPVAATYHTPDGLNAQVYNRCIGSRYCSNNCPFRVRYFNFYSYYESSWPEPLNMQLNPDLSVRDKGVMEKCTFCIQRIRVAKDKAKMATASGEKPKVEDGSFTTACAQACPTSAITFGDYQNPDSQVAKLWKQQQVVRRVSKQEKENKDLRGYRIFEHLNVDPSIMYMERVREEV